MFPWLLRQRIPDLQSRERGLVLQTRGYGRLINVPTCVALCVLVGWLQSLCMFVTRCQFLSDAFEISTAMGLDGPAMWHKLMQGAAALSSNDKIRLSSTFHGPELSFALSLS